MLERLGRRRRQAHRHATRRDARRAARSDAARHDALQRLSAHPDRQSAGRRTRQPDDPVPRHRRPLLAERRQPVATLYATAASATTNPAVSLRPSAATAASRRRSPTISRARSCTRARAIPPGPGRSATARRRSAPTTCSTAPRRSIRNRTGSISPRWRSRRPTSSSACSPTSSSASATAPVPRFWYFPHDKRAVVIRPATSTAAAAARASVSRSTSTTRRRAARWRTGSACAPRRTSIQDADMDDAEAASWAALGFDLGVHVNTDCADWTPGLAGGLLRHQFAALRRPYPSLPPPDTNRTHCIAWSDWATQPRSSRRGVRLDTNYYYWPPDWVQNRPGLFTGSGMPMRFADIDGSLIDIYQAVTQMTDESGQSFPFTIDTLLDRAVGSSATTARSPPTCTPTPATTARQRDRRLGAGARRAARVGAADARSGSTRATARRSTSPAGTATRSPSRSPRLGRDRPARHVAAGARHVPADRTDPRTAARPFTTQTVKGVGYGVFDASAGTTSRVRGRRRRRRPRRRRTATTASPRSIRARRRLQRPRQRLQRQTDEAIRARHRLRTGVGVAPPRACATAPAAPRLVCIVIPATPTRTLRRHRQRLRRADGRGLHRRGRCCTAAAGAAAGRRDQCTGDGSGTSCSVTAGSRRPRCATASTTTATAVDEGNPGGGGACSTGQPGVCGAGTRQCRRPRSACATRSDRRRPATASTTTATGRSTRASRRRRRCARRRRLRAHGHEGLPATARAHLRRRPSSGARDLRRDRQRLRRRDDEGNPGGGGAA